MRKIFWTISIGLIALLAASITMPARIAWTYLSPNLPQVQLSGIEGSVWRGEASQIAVNQVNLGKLTWRVSISSLWRLRPSVDATLDGLVKASANLSRVDDMLHITQLQAEADAAWLKPALAIPALTPTGILRARFSELVLDSRGLPMKAFGSIVLEKAGVTGLAQAQIGDIRIDMSPEGQGIKGAIESADVSGNLLRVQGEFSLIGRDYTAQVRLFPNQANDALMQTLRWVGQPLDDPNVGARLLKITGQIQAQGDMQ
jgi:Type II secretion system (T2SS), protein N